MSEQRQRPVGRGFTLVELLVVIGIIAILIGILLPTLSRVREASNATVCQSNLREIHHALVMYGNDNKDVFPDKDATGNWGFRRRPGYYNTLDPSSYPEWLGLPAVLAGIKATDYNFGMSKAQVAAGVKAQLAKPRYLAAGNNWLCPSFPDRFVDYGNTYAWSNAAVMGQWTSLKRGRKIDVTVDQNSWIAWCDFNLLPWATGAIKPPTGSTSSYTLAPNDKWILPHRGNAGRVTKATNFLFMDGHVSKMTYTPGATSVWSR